MKTFVEEYGLAIFSAIVTATLIIICTPIGGTVRRELNNVIKTYREEDTTYNVVFYAGEGRFDDGTSVLSVEATKNEPIGSLPEVHSDRYSFGGWYTTASGGTRINENTVITSDCKYYALWNTSAPIIDDNKINGLSNGILYHNSEVVGPFGVGTEFIWHDYEWQVLKIDNNKALIISKNVLDKNFNANSFEEGVPWNSNMNWTGIDDIEVLDYYANSNLNDLLEERFYKGLSYLKSDSAICGTNISVGTYQDENAYENGVIFTRHVFALSRTEAKNLLDSNTSRSAENGGVNYSWWTRTGRGKYCELNQIIGEEGTTENTCSGTYYADEVFAVLDNGNLVNANIVDKIGLRPAMYIDLTKVSYLEIME